jgi:hypothetical protein
MAAEEQKAAPQRGVFLSGKITFSESEQLKISRS